MANVQMPRLSDSMEEGTILKWLKSDGDEVAPGDELVEIETDKATMTYEADASGSLRILAPEGETLPVMGTGQVDTLGSKIANEQITVTGGGGTVTGGGTATGGGAATGGGDSTTAAGGGLGATGVDGRARLAAKPADG